MVSNIKYYSFKDLNVFSRKPFMPLVGIILSGVILVLEPQIVFFAMAAGYALSGPGWYILKCFRKVWKKKEVNQVEPSKIL
jgi:CDP-diacylglycerol--serine O-phosphatidyltransferase